MTKRDIKKNNNALQFCSRLCLNISHGKRNQFVDELHVFLLMARVYTPQDTGFMNEEFTVSLRSVYSFTKNSFKLVPNVLYDLIILMVKFNHGMLLNHYV